jgi:SNF2 family DNA or RNA helicase
VASWFHHSLETSFYHQNTFEERINDMINNKLALAELTVSVGENRIGKLSNKVVKKLFIYSF